jgi:hypothetical protein
MQFKSRKKFIGFALGCDLGWSRSCLRARDELQYEDEAGTTNETEMGRRREKERERESGKQEGRLTG